MLFLLGVADEWKMISVTRTALSFVSKLALVIGGLLVHDVLEFSNQ
jgi:hypothetical protein